MQDEILRQINNQNPWWVKTNFEFAEADWLKRDYFNQILEGLKRRQMLGITGLRRVDKTTLLRQLISHLLRNSTHPKNVFYFSFDEALIARNPQILEQVINAYIEQILIAKVFDLNQTVYIFFDEIQYIPLWQTVLKRYYVASRNIKFIISGSASLFISQDAVESLAGRIIEMLLPPLSFREFLNLRNESLTLPPIDLKNVLNQPISIDQNWYALYQDNLSTLFSRFLF